MAKIVKKTFQVLKDSWIGKRKHKAGDIVTIDVNEETWQTGANLKEITDAGAPKHSEAEQKQADEAGKQREVSVANKEKAEKAEEAPKVESASWAQPPKTEPKQELPKV